MHILPSEEDAEDALQDAFLKLWPKAGDIETEKDAVAMTSVTIRNLSIDRYRKQQHSPTVDIEGKDMAEETASEPVMVEDKMRIVEEIMVRTLSETQQTIIRLRDYEGKSYEEIGQILGMQPTAVRMQLSRARKAIREEYRRLHTE
jgi:RNA polymerase sigma-70 factor (ECF subfamily)